MDFEKFINYSEFILNPEQAIKKAQQLMQEAVKEEKLQLQEKAKAQEDANRAAYQAALQALKQQYEELREAEGLNELQKKVDSYELSAADKAVASLQSEVNKLKEENEKLRQEKEKSEETVERVKEKAKETVPKSGTAAHDVLKDFYDSDASAKIKDHVRFLASDEALECVAQLNAGLTEEEILEMGYEEVPAQEEPPQETQPQNKEKKPQKWGELN